MTNLPVEFQDKIFGFIAEKVSSEDFETWLYNEKALEELLREDEYFDLISFNYKQDKSNTKFSEIILNNSEKQTAFKSWFVNSLPINEINFKVENTDYGDGEKHPQLIIQIDGRDFVEIVADFEKKMKFNPAGSYLGPIFHHSVKDELLGTPEYFTGVDDNKCEILECECGVSGCWTLCAKVDVLSNDIFWSHFENIHRNDEETGIWDYLNFSFRFDKEQYLEALDRVFASNKV